MRFFFLPSLVALVLLNLWFPVHPAVYLSHCAQDRHALQARALAMKPASLPEADAEDTYPDDLDGQQVALEGLEALAQTMIQKLKMIR